nr:hypothetical protein [Tanacetum cinerariifolium]
MIPEPGDTNREVHVNETFHVQTDNELVEKELEQIEADDQAIQTIFLGLPEDIYAAEKKAKLFNEWKMFTSNEGESIESYNHRFLKLMNDLKRNKHFQKRLPGIGMGTTLYRMSGIRLHRIQEFRMGVGHFARNCMVRPRRRDAAYLQTQLLIAQKEEARIQLQAEEFDLMGAAVDLDEIKKVNANCILMANLQQASTSGTQTDKALVYDSDGSAEVHDYENCYDNEIFNMFTQEEQYTKLLDPIPEQHQVPQNDNNVISEVTSVEKKEAAKFVGDFKSLATEADESLAKHKALELEIKRLLRAIVSQDIMSVVQKDSVVDTLNLQTELERTKERFENCIIKKENEYAKLWND